MVQSGGSGSCLANKSSDFRALDSQAGPSKAHTGRQLGTAQLTENQESGTEMAEAMQERVIEIICEQLNSKPEDVRLEASFIDDLGADSLDIVELVMAMEDAFSMDIPDEEAERIQTVKDAIEYIRAHMN